MTFTDQKQSIKNFIKEREGKGYEKGQSQPFWIDLLSKVLGVENPTQFIEFEDHVKSTLNKKRRLFSSCYKHQLRTDIFGII